jgi:hypothetical protein
MNDLLSPVVILKNTALRLENHLTFTKFVDRTFDDKFEVPDAKAGYTVNARLPVRFRGRRGDAMQEEDIREQMVPIKLDTMFGTDMVVSDADLSVVIDRFGERYIEPAAETIANMIDSDGAKQFVNVSNHVGTPGVVPTALKTYAKAGVALSNMAVPEGAGPRTLVVNPDMEAEILGFNSNLFNPAKEISEQYRTGKMGIAVGWKWNMDQNVGRQTTGALGTAGAITSNPLVNTANQSGSSLITDGWDANITGVLKKGDIISVLDVNSVNPVSFINTGKRLQLVVTADVDSDGGGNATIPVLPPINADSGDVNTPGDVFQTADALPANNAQIFVYETAYTLFANIASVSSAQALGYHREAFAFACAPLELSGGLDWSERITHPKLGISIRLERGKDIKANRRYTRLDVLGGWNTPRPVMAVRISG